jgi:hypothetical protein
MKSKSYMETGLRLGFTEEQLKSGNEYKSTIEVNSIDELKELLEGPSDDKRKREFTNSLREQYEGFDEPNEQSSGDLLQARIRAHIYGDLTLTKFDRKMSAPFFPMKVDLTVQDTVKIDKPTIIGKSSDNPQVVNYGTLTFEGNGNLYVENTILTLTADHLVISGTTSPYLFGIFGVTGAVGNKGATGAASTDGKAGTNAGDSSGSSAGTNGSDGGKGTAGERGGDGLPSQAATITIQNSFTGNLTVFTQSGNGGKGGEGGDGYKGGDGGKGGNGYSVCCGTTYNPSNGGNGGNGGDGSEGGQGGDGVDGHGPINIIVPAANIPQVQTTSKVASPGDGGGATNGANGGTGGAAGSQTESDQSPAKGGNDGSPGSGAKPGSKGQKNGNPATINVMAL